MNYINTRAIVLGQTKYSDEVLIINLLTEQFGRRGCLLRQPKKHRRQALFLPLMPLNIVASEVPHSDFLRLKETAAENTLLSISSSMTKRSIALFIAEVIYRSVRDFDHDEPLFTFVWDSVLQLEHDSDENFHLYFMLYLSAYLGFAPDLGSQTSPTQFFDLINGIFVDSKPTHKYYLDPDEATLFAQLQANNQPSFSNNDRRLLLNMLTQYYSLHVPDFAQLNSLDVLKSVFSS